MDSDTFFLHELDRTSTLAAWLSEAVIRHIIAEACPQLSTGQRRTLYAAPFSHFMMQRNEKRAFPL